METPTPGPHKFIDRPQSYEEMKALPGFIEVLDESMHKLGGVLTDYAFPKLAPCGRKSCRRAHYEGFLVETSGGKRANLGHICGRRAYGEDFLAGVIQVKAHRERESLIRRAQDLRQQVQGISQKVRDLNGCRRQSKFDPPCQSNIDPGMGADRVMVSCG